MNNRVYPYIETENFAEYKEFLSQEFIPEYLANLKGLKPIKLNGFLESNEEYDEKLLDWELSDKLVLFEGWTGKDMNKWFKFTNGNNKIELFHSYYVIYSENIINDKYELPYPETLNDFISDCWRCNIKLHWKKDVLEKFSSYYIHLPKVDIMDYHKMILTKLGKI